ncbi:MAG: replicative DNA helicase [Oscillospiraceae bacterium]|nr:replicative DNA helicase [Oscillospiraceae bacterium]
MDQLEVALEGMGINQPYSIEAEQAVLGAAIIDPELVSAIVEQVRSEYFYVKQNRLIFNEILTLFMANTPSDFVTVVDAVLSAKIFSDENEAKVYLSQLADTVPSLSNILYYAKILKDKYMVRSLMDTAGEILRLTQDSADADLLLESAEQKIYALRQGKDTQSLKHISDAAAKSFDRLRKLSGKDKDKYRGIPTGFRFLDDKLGKMGRSDLVILAARPGMGKTSFALNIATNIASQQKLPVAIFSLEMSNEQLTERILSSRAGISSNSLRTGDIQLAEWDIITNAIGQIADYPIYLDDTPNVTVSDMKAKIRRLNQNPETPNVGVIIVDYIQLMSTGKRNDNRVQEISEITRNLKIMAKELDVPIIALSQLSRSAEKGSGRDGRPQLSDLRDSGSIEQDADVVLFLYRDAYYNKSEDADQTLAECIIAKNRHGESGTIPLSWDGAHTRFYDVDFTHNDDY